MGNSFQKEREELINAGKQLLDLGILTGPEGNFSMQLGENKMLITPSGVKIRELSHEKLIICDFDGNVIEGGTGKPSSGVPMHTMVYNLRPEVASVIHTHSPSATSFAIANEPIPNSLEVLKDFAGGSIPVASPYAPVGTHELAENVKSHMNDSFAILLQNHGVLSFGKNMKHAVKVSWAVEMTAKMVINAKLIGNITTINKEGISE